ncbi:MAG: EAL domain-containing protein [Gammaproteobacteria bacterium]
MESSKLAITHLLVVADEHQTTNLLISSLRQEHVSLRAANALTEAELALLLTRDQWDVLVCYDNGRITLENVIALLAKHEQDIPLLLVTTGAIVTDPLPLFRLGVHDVVAQTQSRYLVLSVQRAARHYQLQRQLRRLEMSQHELEQRYDILLATSTTPISYIQDGVHLYCNDEYARFFGYENAAAIKVKPFLNLLAVNEREHMKSALRLAAAAEQNLTTRILCADNSEQAAELHLVPVDYHGKQCLQLRAAATAGNQAYSETVARLSNQDLVTRVANRGHFLAMLDAAIRKAVQLGMFSTLVVLEISDFDELKAVIGISNTNLLLNDIAQFLQALPGEGNHVGRLADAEFGLLMATGNPDDTLQLVSMIKERCNSYLSAAMPNSLTLHCDVGMALINGHAPNSDTILLRARNWLSSGVNYSDNSPQQEVLDMTAPNARDMLDYLAEALQQKRFTLYYQPIVPIKGGSNHGYEVLIRMIDKEGNELRPGAFLPLAILNGMGEAIDRMVVSLLLASREINANTDSLILNITSNTLTSQTFLPWLGEQLVLHRFPAHRLVLDLSEIDFHGNADNAWAFSHNASKLGLLTAISHFGTAVEPFAILDNLQPGFVILDESVVRDIVYSTHQKANVQALIAALHKRGMQVAAPQVEDMDVLPILWSVGADFVQGYCLQAPTKNMDYAFMEEEEITLSALQQ